MGKKKGNGPSTNIATLVALIGLFIIFYILLVPEETRKEILGEGFTDGAVPLPGYGVTEEGKVLLTTSPGKVYALEKGQYAIPLTSARLYVRDEEEVIDLADRISISKGLFSEDPKTLYFKVDNPSSVDSLNLFFFIDESADIYVDFNGNRVFDGKVGSADLPIELPVKLIRKDNSLEIGLTGTHLFTKSIQLTSLSVKESFTVENRLAKRSFVLSSAEKYGLRRGFLDYFINCMSIDPRNQGELMISLNSRVIFSDFVVCDAGPQSLTLDVSEVKEGSNLISFEISKGDYSLESMQLFFDISEKFYPQYSFDLNDEDYDSIKGECDSTDYDGCTYNCNRDCRSTCSGYSNYNSCYDDCFEDCEGGCFDFYCKGAKELILQLEFPNSKDRKIASITVNEDVINIDTTKDVFFRDISSSTNRGANYIKIVPKNDFEITSLIVSLEPQT